MHFPSMPTDDSDPTAAAWRHYLDTGDEEAMDTLVARTRPRLRAAARRIVSHNDAEDAVQSAYLALVRRGDAVRDIAPMPWLLTAVVRLAYRQAARRRREVDVVRRLSSPGGPSCASCAELGADESEVVRRTVSELPDGYRDAVVLHYLSGLSVAETASALGISDGAVRVRLHRARAMLRARPPLRALRGLFLLPLGVFDRLRAWRAASCAGPTGIASLPGSGVAAAVLLGFTFLAGWGGRDDAAASSRVATADASPLARTGATREAPARSNERTTPKDDTSAPVGERDVMETFFVGGKLATRCEVERRDGEVVRHGRFEAWRVDGSRESIGTYVDGLRQGRWVDLHENGRKLEEGTYLDDEMHGLWTGWEPDGQKTSETRYERGMRHGVSRTWVTRRRWEGAVRTTRRSEGCAPVTCDEPSLSREESHRHGLRHGEWRFYEHNGWLREIRTYRDGALDGPLTVFHCGRRTSVTMYVDDVAHGKQTSYSLDGRVVGTTEWSEGKQHGEVTSFYPDGGLRFRQSYRHGRLHGPTVMWHPNGRKSHEFANRDGKPLGPTKRWNARGRLVLRGEYGQTGATGTWTTWSVEGERTSEGRYESGARSGTWGFRLPGGDWAQLEYANGRPDTGTLVGLDESKSVTHAVDYVGGRRHGRERRWNAAGALILRGEWTDGRKSGVWETLEDGEVVDRVSHAVE